MSNPPIPGIRALPRELVQIAYIVPDLEAACRDWGEKGGVGPFLMRPHMDIQGTHDGQPARYHHSAAFGQWGPLMLELIEVHDCSPASMHEFFAHSAPNQVNHFAYFVEDLAASSAAPQEQGFPLMMELVSSSGMQVHFLDGRSTIGGLIEIYEGSEHLRSHYARVAELARGWDGSEPVRYM